MYCTVWEVYFAWLLPIVDPPIRHVTRRLSLLPLSSFFTLLITIVHYRSLCIVVRRTLVIAHADGAGPGFHADVAEGLKLKQYAEQFPDFKQSSDPSLVILYGAPRQLG